MMKVHPYLFFDGNCEQAFAFYQQLLNCSDAQIMRFKDMPADENIEVPDDKKDKIMHITLKLDDGSLLMGSDTLDPSPDHLKQGNNFGVSLSVDSDDRAEEIFTKLSEQGEVRMPFERVFWGSMFGMVRDHFGITWMISSD